MLVGVTVGVAPTVGDGVGVGITPIPANGF